jgi:hypothetical protein
MKIKNFKDFKRINENVVGNTSNNFIVLDDISLDDIYDYSHYLNFQGPGNSYILNSKLIPIRVKSLKAVKINSITGASEYIKHIEQTPRYFTSGLEKEILEFALKCKAKEIDPNDGDGEAYYLKLENKGTKMIIRFRSGSSLYFEEDTELKDVERCIVDLIGLYDVYPDLLIFAPLFKDDALEYLKSLRDYNWLNGTTIDVMRLNDYFIDGGEESPLKKKFLEKISKYYTLENEDLVNLS